jgi:tetratricopeptide (TPR) repeat protein
MGFLGSLFGGRIQNENTSKRFVECRSAAERKEWFARTRPWNRVSPTVIAALASRLDGEPTTFERFVATSFKCGLIPMYERLNSGSGIAPTMVAALLCQAGATSMRQMFALRELLAQERGSQDQVDEAAQHTSLSVDAYEVALALDRNSVPAYGGLASILAMTGRAEEALKYAKQGIEVIREMKDTPFHLSSIESVREGGAQLDEAERHLLQMVEALEEGRRAASVAATPSEEMRKQAEGTLAVYRSCGATHKGIFFVMCMTGIDEMDRLMPAGYVIPEFAFTRDAIQGTPISQTTVWSALDEFVRCGFLVRSKELRGERTFVKGPFYPDALLLAKELEATRFAISPLDP